MLLLQGQLALGVPEAAQGVEPVFQEPGVRVALVPAHGAQALRQLRRVLGLEGQDLGREKWVFIEVLRGGKKKSHMAVMCFLDQLFSTTDGGILFLISGKAKEQASRVVPISG